jgi:hypothetical protein
MYLPHQVEDPAIGLGDTMVANHFGHGLPRLGRTTPS